MRACPRRARLAQTQSGETRGTTSNRKCKSADSCRPFQACRCRRPGYSKNVVSAHNGRLGQINVNVPPRKAVDFYLLGSLLGACWCAGGSPTGGSACPHVYPLTVLIVGRCSRLLARGRFSDGSATPAAPRRRASLHRASPPRVCSLCSHAVRACPRSARARR